ncbi:MAG: EFR1 family ferrodoxin [Spirochaetales bacterium]|nr:EFR1 family ferrodoxin [Spirochaetales bacterium]
MKNIKIAIVYFSGTHVTKSYAEVIQAHLTENGFEAQLFDITPFSARRTALPAEQYHGLIFGSPVFADFLPCVMDDWLPTLRGAGKPCAVFVTYGGRTSGYAHFHALSLLNRAGFLVQFSADFLGRHTFNLAGWDMLSDRPNEQDFAVAREFAALVKKRFTHPHAHGLTLQKPFGYDRALAEMLNRPPSSERKWTNPRRFFTCSLCGACESECPVQAIDHQTGMSDPAKCIECLHCMHICPDKALKADEHMEAYYPAFLKEWNLTEDLMSRKQGKIITDALHASF